MFSPTLATLLDEWLDDGQSDSGLSPNSEACCSTYLREDGAGHIFPAAAARFPP